MEVHIDFFGSDEVLQKGVYNQTHREVVWTDYGDGVPRERRAKGLLGHHTYLTVRLGRVMTSFTSASLRSINHSCR